MSKKNFNELREKVVADPERRERVERIEEAYDALLNLADLREARGVTQVQLAGMLGVSQPAVSKIERGENVSFSTLIRYVQALGGHLELKASFPDHPEHEITARIVDEVDDRESAPA